MAERDEQFWASFFGIDAAAWGEPGTSLVPHAGLGDYAGLWSFQHGPRCIVSAPRSWLDELRPHVTTALRTELGDEAWWRARLGPSVERVIGPAYQGCLSAAEFSPVTDPRIELLTSGVEQAVRTFRDGIDDETWSDGGLDHATAPAALIRDSGRVVALCGYRPWSESAGDPCVLVHPDFRGRGYATAVTSAVVQAALAGDRLVLYQTLDSYRAAVAIASRLGFRRFATHLAVRLRNA